MAITFVQNVGTATSANKTTAAVTVPAGGCAAGNVLVVRSYTSNGGSTVSSIVDTASGGSNTYSQFAADRSYFDTSYLYYSYLDRALASGDTITITVSGMGDMGLAVDEFSGVTSTKDGTNTAANTQATAPSVSLTTQTQAECLVFGNLGLDDASGFAYTEDTDTDGGDSWHTLTATAGFGSSNRIRGAYKITTSVVTQTWSPTITNSGNAYQWQMQIGALKALASAGIPYLVTARR